MKNKNLIILVCLAAVLMTVAVVTSKKQQNRSSSSSRPQLLFKELPVNDITRIAITTPAGEIELERADKGWVMPAKFNYPVKFDKIKEALMALAELKAGDQRDLNDEQKKKVRMVSPLKEDAALSSVGSLFQAYTSGNKPVAALLIGTDKAQASRERGAPGGRYVSTDSGDTVLLTSQYVGSLEATDALSWLANDMVSVNSFSITNMTISAYDEKPITLYTDEEGELTMNKLSRREMVDESKSRSVRYTLSYLRFDDIANPDLDDKTMGFDKPSTFTAVTTHGEVYTITLGGNPEGSDSRYARVSAQFAAPTAEQKESSDKDKANQDADSKEIEEAKQRVETVNARCSGWTYILTPAKFNTMLYTRKDLVTKKEKDD